MTGRIIEGNSWNFSFHVPHDVAGLIRLMGGEKKFVSRLDTLFSMALPRKYYEKNEDIAEVSLVEGMYMAMSQSSHSVSVCLDFPTLEDAILAADGHEPDV